jgi:hypothetical protein
MSLSNLKAVFGSRDERLPNSLPMEWSISFKQLFLRLSLRGAKRRSHPGRIPAPSALDGFTLVWRRGFAMTSHVAGATEDMAEAAKRLSAWSGVNGS